MTETRKYLKPAEGRTVRREDGSPWPEAGDWAELTLFVRRRVEDRDLVEAEPPAELDPPASAEAIDPPPPPSAPEGGKPPKSPK